MLLAWQGLTLRVRHCGKGAERHVARGGAPQAPTHNHSLLNIHVLHNPHALNRRCVGSSQFTAPRPTSRLRSRVLISLTPDPLLPLTGTSTCNEL